jgi:hypothetical protein
MINAKQVTLLFTLTGLLFATSCKKSSTTTNPSGSSKTVKDVYVGGFIRNSSGKTVAAYWKNGTYNALTDGTRNATARSVFIEGDKVYAAGYQDKAGSVLNIATYWENGVAHPLGTTGGTFDAAVSIFVQNNNVHLAGYERNHSSGNDMAKYWGSGAPLILESSNNESRALGVFVSGTDVYVAGYEEIGGDNIAKYWKNGVPVILSDGATDAEALSIFVSGSDVYVGGAIQDEITGNYQAVYWKNGTMHKLTTASNQAGVYSIAVSGADVYAAGIDVSALNYAVLWKKGLQKVLMPPPLSLISIGGGASSVAVNDVDVYVAGQLTSSETGNPSFALYWKNGQAVSLSSAPGGDYGSSASSIFLTYE